MDVPTIHMILLTLAHVLKFSPSRAEVNKEITCRRAISRIFTERRVVDLKKKMSLLSPASPRHDLTFVTSRDKSWILFLFAFSLAARTDGKKRRSILLDVTRLRASLIIINFFSYFIVVSRCRVSLFLCFSFYLFLCLPSYFSLLRLLFFSFARNIVFLGRRRTYVRSHLILSSLFFFIFFSSVWYPCA